MEAFVHVLYELDFIVCDHCLWNSPTINFMTSFMVILATSFTSTHLVKRSAAIKAKRLPARYFDGDCLPGPPGTNGDVGKFLAGPLL